MKVVSVLLGAVAIAGVGSKPIAKLVHLYFSNIYIYMCVCVCVCVAGFRLKKKTRYGRSE